MPRFSTGFYVGSMKNVPPALLAGNTTGTTITTITTILAPVLAFHVFREYIPPVYSEAATFATREQL